MSLLSHILGNTLRAQLSTRMTPGGVRLEDVIRSGVCHPDSAIGVYAPDFQSYEVFRELFQPILRHFQAPPLIGKIPECLNRSAVLSTRIRVGRNLAGHAFPAGMSRPERLAVEAKIVRACRALGREFPGEITSLGDLPRAKLDTLIARRLAFGPDDKYMAAAAIHADWPAGRSVFNTHDGELSVWINEEDHLRVAVVMPGASISACAEVLARAMSCLSIHLDFCVDERLGHLTSCPSNVGSAMRPSYMVNLRQAASQQPLLDRLESEGGVQIRGANGEHSARRGQVDIGFRNRVGVTATQMLQDMEALVASVFPSAGHRPQTAWTT